MREAARLAGVGADGALFATDLLPVSVDAASEATVRTAVNGSAMLGGLSIHDLPARLGHLQKGLDQVVDSKALMHEAVELARKFGPADAEGVAPAFREHGSQGAKPV